MIGSFAVGRTVEAGCCLRACSAEKRMIARVGRARRAPEKGVRMQVVNMEVEIEIGISQRRNAMSWSQEDSRYTNLLGAG